MVVTPSSEETVEDSVPRGPVSFFVVVVVVVVVVVFVVSGSAARRTGAETATRAAKQETRYLLALCFW
jgi:hypothetical protein